MKMKTGNPFRMRHSLEDSGRQKIGRVGRKNGFRGTDPTDLGHKAPFHWQVFDNGLNDQVRCRNRFHAR
jgi:hypothetical protein